MTEEFINELKNNYEINEQRIRKYDSMLNEYPCVIEGEIEKRQECLEIFIQDRISIAIMEQENPLKRNVKESLEDSIYRVYGDKSLPYLSDYFKKMHEIDESFSYLYKI